MAALIPMRYSARAGEAPVAIASNARSSARAGFIESSVRRDGVRPRSRLSAFKARHLGRDPLLLVARVHRGHQRAVGLGREPALPLPRRRDPLPPPRPG